MTARAKFYRVVLTQYSAPLDVVLADADEAALYGLATQRPRVFSVWCARPGGGAQMMVFDPTQPGFGYSSRPAGPIPCDAARNPLPPGSLAAGQQPPHVANPADEDYGRIARAARLIVPPWAGPTSAENARDLSTIAARLLAEINDGGGRRGDDLPLPAPVPDATFTNGHDPAIIDDNGAAATMPDGVAP